MTELQINKSQLNTNKKHNNNMTRIRICGNFLTHDPTQHTKKLKISTQPDPTQSNPLVDPTHGQAVDYCAAKMNYYQ